MRRHHELCPLSCIDRSQRSKSQNERKEEGSYHDQSNEPHRLSRVLTPRRKKTLHVQDATRELYVFNTASGPILRCRGWTLAGTPCTLINACHNGVIIPGGLQNTNRTEGGNSASGSCGPGTLPRRDDGTQGPPPFKRLDSPGASFGCKPSLGTGTIRSVATSPSTVSAPSISAAARGDVDDGSLASASRGRRIHWGPVEYGHGNGSDWCVIT